MDRPASMDKNLARLEDWLRRQDLPEGARTCIENFVCTCEQPRDGDDLNFISDIELFPIEIQECLMSGYTYAYTGKSVAFRYDGAEFQLFTQN
jgi:hypothetical protein